MGHQAAGQRGLQAALKLLTAHLDRAELREMSGDELRVEQGKAAIFEPRHQINQRDLASVALAREHALAEERAAEMDAVEPAGERTVLPYFDGVAMA